MYIHIHIHVNEYVYTHARTHALTKLSISSFCDCLRKLPPPSIEPGVLSPSPSPPFELSALSALPVCVCMSGCVCERETGRERERETGRERDRETEKETV